jgi:hypothetical protein
MMATRDDQMMLMRIIALLFSLACLAESLVGLSPQRRSLIMRLLRPGEMVARGLLADEAGGRRLRCLPSPVSFEDDGPEDAMRLAACFRALAFALEAILMQFSSAGAFPAQARKPEWRNRRLARHRFALVPAAVLDTS